MSAHCTIHPESEWKEGMEGFFRLSEQTYRQADGWSQSTLKHVLRSPACVEQAVRYPIVPTWSMELGTLTHNVILEPDTFGEGKSHYICPLKYEAEDSRTKKQIAEGVPYVPEYKPWSANSNVCKQWLKDHADKPVLTLEEHDTILAMKNQFHGDEFGSMFAKKGNGEVSVFHRDEETGIMLKGKLDLFAVAKNMFLIGDLKICADGDEFEFAQQAARMKYHVQTAFYIDIVNGEIARQKITTDSPTRFLHCTLENKRPHFLEWRELDAEAIHEGRLLCRRAIAEFAKAQESGFFSMIRPISLPRWAVT